MPLVPAKCPECGGNININPDKKAAVCEFCKQPFIVEEAIKNFNTSYSITNNNNIKADVVNVYEESKTVIQEANNILSRVLLGIDRYMDTQNKYDKTIGNALADLMYVVEKAPNEIELRVIQIKAFNAVTRFVINGGCFDLGELRSFIYNAFGRSDDFYLYVYVEAVKILQKNNYGGEELDDAVHLFNELNSIVFNGTAEGTVNPYSDIDLTKLIFEYIKGHCLEPHGTTAKAVNNYLWSRNDVWRSIRACYGRTLVWSDYNRSEDYYFAKSKMEVASVEEYKVYEESLQNEYKKHIKLCRSRKVCSVCGSPLSLFSGNCKTNKEHHEISFDEWALNHM